jgi:hypothetical protein
MTGHARLSPSGAARWVACPGSVTLEAAYPDDTSSELALEGTAAHWALAEVLEGRAVAEGQVTDTGFVLTREMVEAAESVLRLVHTMILQYDEQPEYRVERTIPINRVHPECWGTPDLVMYFRKTGVIVVLDFKYGHGFVEVHENWQLLAYLAGVLELFNISGLQNEFTTCHLIIDQPRSYHPDGPRRWWSITPDQARPYIVRLGAAARAALGPDPQLEVSSECKYCNARHACPQLQAHALDAVDRSRSAVPFDLPPHALGVELADVQTAIKALEARASGLQAQAEALIERGERVPFWSMERPPGRLAWSVPPAEVLALGHMLGVPLAKPVEPITPTQARDLGLSEELLQGYAARPAGKAKLVMRGDDSARKIFS